MFKNKKIIFGNLDKRGTTLLLAILILAVIFAIAIGVSDIILRQMKITERVEDSVLAFYAADSGIECELYNNFKNGSENCKNLLSGGVQIFNITTSTNSIEVIGQAFSTRRGIKVEW